MWEWKGAAATLHLARGRHGIWQSRGGSHGSHEAMAMWGGPAHCQSNQARRASQRWLARVGREVSVRYFFR